MTHDTQTTHLLIEGMSCASCVSRLEKVLSRQAGTLEVSVNLATESAHIRHTADWQLEQGIAAIRKAGFDAHQKPDSPVVGSAPVTPWSVLLSLLAAAALMLPMLGLPIALPAWLQFAISTPVQFVAGAVFMRGAWGALRNRQANMDVLVALGSFTAWAYSTALWLTAGAEHLFFEAGVAIIAFVLLGKWLEKKARDQTAQAIAGLETLRPAQVSRLRAGTEGGPTLDSPTDTVALCAVRVGDVLKAGAGERLACDGIVLDGRSHVDESALTGEPMPADKAIGSSVHAGTLNLEGQLLLRVSATGSQTLLGQVIHLIEQAQGRKLPVQEQVDKVAAVFVPVVLVIALFTGVAWALSGASGSAALMHAVTVVVVACPCALGLATPAAIIAGTGAAARAGLLIRDPRALHTARLVNVIVLDKTGTLTQGKPTLQRVTPFSPGLSQDNALALAAALQMQRSHPLGHALLVAARDSALSLPSLRHLEQISGIGMTAQWVTHEGADPQPLLLCHVRHALTLLGASEQHKLTDWMTNHSQQASTVSVLLTTPPGQATQLLAALEFNDRLRPEAAQVLQQLKARSLRLVLLSGDRPEAVQALSGQLALDEARGACTPAEKARYIETLKASGQTVAMVGDGINDAPAMALADLAIAMGGGTDLAAQTAHVTLMKADLRGILHTLDVARRIQRNITENLFWAFAYNAICIPLAAIGLFNPMMAAAAMAASSVSVVGNAMRLTRWTPAND
jgi:Cu+-exporting ATPase